jgi:LysR family nitrogen assimilation transcriptional regulator
VKTGLGHAILPKGDFSDMPGHQDIITVPIEPAIYLTACLITTRDKPLTRAAAAIESQLLGFIRSQVGESAFAGAEWADSQP